MQKIRKQIIAFIMSICLCTGMLPFAAVPQQVYAQAELADIPSYTGSPYTQINDNIPDFSSEDHTSEAFETYSDLDELGRCQEAYANVGQELMPTQKRGKIGQVKPSGWQTVKYDDVDGGHLYNRCHLIGYQLTAENANEKNLITGTRYMNVDGMLPFENMVADYIKETGNHVLYRVTPIFNGDDLVARGVEMEAESVEDDGEGIQFHVFCYNVQPGIGIDYATGDSWEEEAIPLAEEPDEEQTQAAYEENTYIINVNTGKFHYPECSSVKQMNESNKQTYTGSREDLISQGYESCKRCHS